MKVFLFSYLFSILFMNLANAATSPTDRAGNGGDICEDQFKIVRDDIQSWIAAGGPQGLRFNEGRSLQRYNSLMPQMIANARVSCTEQIIQVGNAEKTCTNFQDPHLGPQIVCNAHRFLSTSESAQYILVHHEYAGLAGLEMNKGPDSDYSISNQISEYLEDRVTKKLAIKKPAPDQSGPASVCERSTAVRHLIQEALFKECGQITRADLARVADLDLEGLHLTHLQPLDFRGLTGLKKLNLAVNSLTDLDQNLFRDLKSIETISLRRNHISRLPAQLFAGLRTLKTLDLSENLIQNLEPDLLKDLDSLVELTIIAANLQSLANRPFRNLGSLKFLNLDQNPIADFAPGAFEGLSALEDLHLDSVEITSFSAETFLPLIALRTLTLESNELRTLPDGAFRSMRGLERLSLRSNPLNHISKNVFNPENFSDVARVDLLRCPLSNATLDLIENQLGPRLLF